MNATLRRVLSLGPARIFYLLALCAASGVFFFYPGVSLVRDLRDPALRGPGIPDHARSLHRSLTPRLTDWANERIVTGRAAQAALHDVPTTEWPMFTAVFYLMASDSLQEEWLRGNRQGQEPMGYAREAVDAARDLLVDPSHHTWVRTHWGDGYLHRENVFFRSLLIAGLTSHEKLTHDGTSLPLLRDQVETLAAALDDSEVGLLNDYPQECYPIDVLVAIGFIRRADVVLGTDHSAFVARSIRAFEGELADEHGLVPYRWDLDAAEQVQPSRGIGNSWVAQFAPDLWPDRAKTWYALYDEKFWQDRGWAAGFREYAKGSPESEWTAEVDAGPVLDGFGTSASAFGIAAARRNGRFDHAYTLSSQLAAASWALPGGTLAAPRGLSHAADAPYLGESAIAYFLTVQPAAGVPIVTGGRTPGLVYLGFLVYFGVPMLVLAYVVLSIRRVHPVRDFGVPQALRPSGGSLPWDHGNPPGAL